MKLPLSWLKEYIDVDITPQELETKLFDSGFEVEELKYLGEEISNCVVGEIINIEKHPDSDHLQICQLNCGKYGNPIQIVTGAQNVFVGAKVPVALNGSTLAGGVKIKNGKLRGVASNGMLCSGGELGITEDFYPNAGVDGILILPTNTEIGKDIKKIVGLDDWVFDISITANRPDAESVIGMAREISAILDKPLHLPEITYTEKIKKDYDFKVSVQDTENCPLYLASIVDNIKIETSPIWLRQRLIKCDINSINNIVDITNYILLELGQPMHAFDLVNLAGNEIIVRSAKDGEKITTLDEKESTLNSKNLVVADKDKPVALAGIMGGLYSSVSNTTSTIVFESAKFLRESIRKTSRAIGISSDSSHRFEKGIDEFTTEFAIKRALNLIESLGAGEVSSTHITVKQKEQTPKVIKTTYGKIHSVLGISISTEIIRDILKRLNFKILSGNNNEILEIEVPLYRTDMDGAEDIAEEVIRMYGYSHIPPKLLPNTHITNGGLNALQKNKLRTKKILAGLGFNEIVTYSFYGPKDLDLFRIAENAVERKYIKILNPITEDNSIMKTILAPSTLGIINKNMKKGIESGKFFELANIYLPNELPIKTLPHEQLTLSFGVFGKNETFFTLKGLIENFADVYGKKFTFLPCEKSFLHPYRSAKILLDNEEIGFIGQLSYEISGELSLDKNIYLAEINYEKFYNSLDEKYQYTAVTKHPTIKRDLALVVEENVLSGDIEKVMRETSKKLTDITLFDVYTGEHIAKGFKSLAYTLIFEPKEEPITHEDVDNQIKKILNRLHEKLGAVIRE